MSTEIICLHCQYSQSSRFAFCGQCGQTVGQVCHSCQQINPAEFQYCGHCSVSLGASPASIVLPASPANHTGTVEIVHSSGGAASRIHERRQVAVLFCDLCGFTKLSETLDPEEVSNIIYPLFKIISDIIHGYQGVIEKFIGDAIMAFFGVPLAHEDDPDRVMMTALEIQKAIIKYGQAHQLDISMRIGLNMGVVVAGEIQYEGEDKDYTVLGDAINTAARIEQNCPKGSILVSDSLYKWGGDRYLFREAAAIQAKGKAQPIVVHELLGVQRLEQARRAGSNNPLFGRETELDSAIEALANPRQAFKSIAISGVAGIGKSRFLQEIYRHQLNLHPGIIQVQVSAVSYSQHASSALIRLLVEALLFPQSNLSEQKNEALVLDILQQGFSFSQLEQELLLYILFPARDSKLFRYRDAEKLQSQWFQVLVKLLQLMTENQAVFIVLEDLQWADQLSLDWLSFLFSCLDGASLNHPLILSASWRHQEQHAQAEYFNYPWKIQVRLDPLSDEACTKLIAHRLELHQLPAELLPLRDKLLERSQHNPYYLIESLRLLVENESLSPGPSGWILNQSLEKLPLPANLQRLILAEFDRLDADSRGVLQAACVCGDGFHLELLANLTGLGMESILVICQELTRNGYFSKGDQLYAFQKELIRETLYQTLLLRRRKELHGKVGLWLESRADFNQADRLAFHFIHAEQTLPALKYLYLAAQQAGRIFATSAAIQSYDKASDLLQDSQLSEDTLFSLDRENKTWLTPAQAAEKFSLELLELRWLIGDYDTALTEIEQQLPEARLYFKAQLHLKQGRIFEKQSCWQEALAAYAAGQQALGQHTQVPEMAQLWNGIAWSQYRQGEYQMALKSSQYALNILKIVPDMREIAYAHNVQGVIFYHQSDWDAALAAYHKSLQIQETIADLWGQGNSLSNMGSVFVMINRWKAAETHFLDSLDLREKIGDSAGIATSCNNLGHIYQELKRPDQAALHLERALRIYQSLNNRLGEAIVFCNLGNAYQKLEHYQQSEKNLKQGISVLKELKAEHILPEPLNMLAEIYLSQDKQDQASQIINETEQHLNPETEKPQAFRHLRLKSWLAAINQDFSQMSASLEQAWTIKNDANQNELEALHLLIQEWLSELKQVTPEWETMAIEIEAHMTQSAYSDMLG